MQNKLAHSAKTGDAKAVQCKCFVACVSLLTYLLTDHFITNCVACPLVFLRTRKIAFLSSLALLRAACAQCSKPMGCCALVLTGRYLLARESRVRPASTK